MEKAKFRVKEFVARKKMGATDYELFGETFSEQEEFFKRRLLNAHNHFLEEMGIETNLTKERI